MAAFALPAYPGRVSTLESSSQPAVESPAPPSLAGISAFPDAVPSVTPGARAEPGKKILLAAPRGYCAGEVGS